MAIERSCTLLQKYADAEIVSGIAKYENADLSDKVIDITVSNINNILGMKMTKEEIIDVFNRLGFSSKSDGEKLTVTVPSRRIDISIKEDLIEEVRTYIWSK